MFKGSLIFSNTSLEFIKKYPNADIISNTRIDALANTMAKLNGRHENYYLKKAKLIKEYASNSYPSVSKDDEKVNNLIITIELQLSYIKQIKNLKSKLISNAKRSYMFNLINSIDGIGEFTTSLIIAELGDISKSDNRYIRKILFVTVQNIILIASRNFPDNDILLYYRKKCNEGKHHYVAVVDSSTKLLRKIFALVKQYQNNI